MDPIEFLKLAAPIRHPDVKTVKFLADLLRKGVPIDSPFLDLVDNASPVIQDADAPDERVCRVISHEGRHRAYAADMVGIEEIPVIIMFEEYFYDKEGMRRVMSKDRREQRCLMCDRGFCYGEVEQETWSEHVRPDTLEIHGGSKRELRADIMPIDYSRVSGVANASKRWRKEHGFE